MEAKAEDLSPLSDEAQACFGLSHAWRAVSNWQAIDAFIMGIILVVPAGLLAVSTIPQLDAAPPVTVEVTGGARVLLPARPGITDGGPLSTANPRAPVSPQEFFDQNGASDSEQLTAHGWVAARYGVGITGNTGQTGRQAVDILQPHQ